MMHRLLRPSLFKRLLAWQMLVLMLAMAASFAWGIWLAYAPRSGGIDRELNLRAQAIARFAALNATPEHAQAVALQVRQLNQDNSDLPVKEAEFAWQVWSSSAQLLAADGMANSFAPMPPASLEVGIRHERGDWRLMAAWSPDNKVWVVIGQAGSVSRRFDARVLRQVILIPLSYALILMAALWLATSRGLKPLALLGQRIAARQAGSQQLIADAAHDPVELQPITAALDAYALRETQLRAAEKRFFADAAHEMRTPLAVIAAQAHVLSQEPHPDRRAELLDGLQSGVQRAAAVLAKVLTLSRLDADDWQADTASTSRVDLGNVLRERVAEHAVRAMDSGHDLGLSEGPPLSVTVDASLLGIAIDNLIDNALNYCPKGSRIDVSWGLQDGVPWCAVEDDGPGIAADERERVFRRFERGAAAHDRVGSGLGLAIASEVALKHGGSLRLEAPALGRGCRFVMRFLMAQ